MSKIPYIIIVGKQEEEKERISVRRHGGQDLGKMKINELGDLIKKEIENLTSFIN